MNKFSQISTSKFGSVNHQYIRNNMLNVMPKIKAEIIEPESYSVEEINENKNIISEEFSLNQKLENKKKGWHKF